MQLELTADNELPCLKDSDDIIIRAGPGLSAVTKCAVLHKQVDKVNRYIQNCLMKRVLEKYDNPLDGTVPQIHEALRIHMGHELARRRAHENRDDQMHTLGNGASASRRFPAKGRGNNLVEKAKDQFC